jgi:PAS domain S-box-containing protein/putative nucleotidyltransferase with HDIG domain
MYAEKLSARLLRESDDRYHNLFELSPDGILIQAGGKIVLANGACAKLLGVTYPEKIVGKSVFDFIPATSRESVHASIKDLEVRKIGLVRFEDRLLKADGSSVDVEITATSCRHENEKGFQLVLRDLTERKRAELALADGDRHFRALIENSSDLIVIVDPRGTITYASPNVERILGYELSDFLNRDIREFLRPDDLTVALSTLAPAANMVGTSNNSAELRYRHKNGNWLLLETLTKNALDDPLIGGIIINARDITGRQQILHELQFKNAVLTTQQQVSPDAILVVNEQAEIISYNRQFVDLWKLPEEMVIAGVDAPVLQNVRGQVRDPIAFVTRVQYLYEHKDENSHEEIELKDGRTIDRFSSGMFGADSTYYGRVWFFRDVTERKRAEFTQRKLTRALMALSQCNDAIIHAIDENDLVRELCRIIVEIAGYRVACIGYAEHDAEKTVRQIAQWGYDGGCLEQRRRSWADNEFGRGPVGTAIRMRSIQLVQNVLDDPDYAPWRDDAIWAGYGSVLAAPLENNGNVFGAISIYAAERNGFDQTEVRLLGELADDLAFGIATLRVRAAHAQSAERLKRSMEGTIAAMAATVDMRDPYTAGHQRRVAELAVAIARKLNLSEDEIHGIRLAGIVHDLGKLTVPAEILSKPSRLTSLEYELIKTHAEAGYSILKEIDFPWPIAQIVYQHHERLDGSGYPRGLKDSDILIGAKILAVADTIEAMASHRPYRPGLGIEKALEEISANRGSSYDVAVADACVQLFRDNQFAFSG